MQADVIGRQRSKFHIVGIHAALLGRTRNIALLDNYNPLIRPKSSCAGNNYPRTDGLYINKNEIINLTWLYGLGLIWCYHVYRHSLPPHRQSAGSIHVGWGAGWRGESTRRTGRNLVEPHGCHRTGGVMLFIADA